MIKKSITFVSIIVVSIACSTHKNKVDTVVVTK